MGNLKQKYTEEELNALEEAIKAEEKAKEQALKDMQEDSNFYWDIEDDLKKKDKDGRRVDNT